MMAIDTERESLQACHPERSEGPLSPSRIVCPSWRSFAALRMTEGEHPPLFYELHHRVPTKTPLSYTAGWPHGQRQLKFLSEPDAALVIDEQTIVGVRVAYGKCACHDLACRWNKVADLLRKRVGVPDVAPAIDRDARDVCSCAVRWCETGPAKDLKNGGLACMRIEDANSAIETACIPDVACSVGCDEVGTFRRHVVFADPNMPVGRGREAADLVYAQRVFGEPDIALRIEGNAVRTASRARGGRFNKRMRACIQEADAISCVFGEPEVSLLIEDQIERRATFFCCPLVPGLVLWIGFADGIAVRLRKPDVARAIDRHKHRAGVAARLVEVGDEAAVGEGIFAKHTLKT